MTPLSVTGLPLSGTHVLSDYVACQWKRGLRGPLAGDIEPAAALLSSRAARAIMMCVGNARAGCMLLRAQRNLKRGPQDPPRLAFQARLCSEVCCQWARGRGGAGRGGAACHH